MIQSADDAFHNVVNVSEIPAVVPVVEYVDGLASQDFLGKDKQCHIRAAPGAVHGKKAQTGGGNAEQMAVGVSHQFIGFFTGGVKADRVVDVVVYRKRHGGIGTVHRAAGGVDQMLGAEVAAGFQNVQKAGDVGVHIGLGVDQRVTHTGLGSQVDDPVGPVFFKGRIKGGFIFQVQAQIGEARVVGDSGQAGFFDVHIVVVVEVIHPDNVVAALQQAQSQGIADKARGAGDQNFHNGSFSSVYYL